MPDATLELVESKPQRVHRGRRFGKKAADFVRKGILECLGPGLITGASDDDPSGVATYSQAGAKYGFGMLWVSVFSLPLMASIQEISARIGRVTGQGIAANLRRYYSKWLSFPLVMLLVLANVINIGADLGAMGAAAKLMIGGSAHLYLLLFAAVSVLLQVLLNYCDYSKFLKWLTLALFAYVGVVFVVRVPWGKVAHATFIPSISFHAEYLALLVAVLGTTISPYLFFWQASLEVQEIKNTPEDHPLIKAPEQTRQQLRRIRVDTFAGMTFSNLIAFFIMLTAAVTLHASGKFEINSAQEAAEALRPIAGALAFVLFGLGIIGTGLLALPVLAGSGAYALGELLKWPTGLERKWKEAKGFYAILIVATAIGTAMNFTKIDPIKALIWSAAINGVVAVPVMFVMMHMAGSTKVMGKLTAVSKKMRVVGWIATLVMLAAAIAFFVTLGKA